MMKIIASDYDGTLRRPDVGITDKDREAIIKWRKEGNLFGVVTGRGDGMDVELKRENVEFDFAITFNGVKIWNQNGNILKEFKGNGKKLYDMLPILLQKEGDWADIVTPKRSYYVTYESETADGAMYSDGATHGYRQVDHPDTWVSNETVKSIEDFIQIYSLRKKDEEALKIAKQLKNIFPNDISALVNGSWVNIAPAGVNKATGVKEYAKIMKVADKDIYTVGDSYNDIDMLKAYNGYAVFNAPDDLKGLATAGVCDGISGLIMKLGYF